jgi:hypothetical protein
MTYGDLFFMLEAFLACVVHEHLVSYAVLLLSHPFIIPYFFLSFMDLDTLFAPLYKRLVDIPEGIYKNDSKQG